MPAAPLPSNEQDRIAALHQLGILDTPPEERFDRITRLAARLFGVDIALVTLVDVNRQWFKSCVGLDDSETPRAESFCAHAILSDNALVIPDATADPRFADNPSVTGSPFIRSYAGVPVRGPRGHHLGTLCLAHSAPREFTPAEIEVLKELAAVVENELTAVRLSDTVAELERARSRLAAVMQAAVEGIVELDHSGRVRFINRAAATTLGYEPDELLGRELHAIAHHSHADGTPYPREECPSHRTLQGGGSFRSANEVFWRKDGTSIDVELTTAPLVADGRTTGAVVTFSDISERRALEQMKEQFVATVSHELRTPLTSIRGYIELVVGGEAGELSAEQAEFLQVAYRNAVRLETLINDLLLVSRLAAGALEFRREPVDLCELVAQVIEHLRPVADGKGVRIEGEFSPAVVQGDPARLQQAVTNLTGNAVKFTPAGKAVRVSIASEGGKATVEVADEGVGIPSDELPRLSERFFRASTAGTTEGTGLGLLITREIVEAHGGEMQIESEVGAGSRFRISLPA